LGVILNANNTNIKADKARRMVGEMDKVFVTLLQILDFILKKARILINFFRNLRCNGLFH